MRLLTLVLVPAALLAGQNRFARLGEFQGPVEVQLTAADPWIPAARNLPLVELAWVRTGAGGRVEIEMDDGSMWRLGPNSLGEISDYTRLSTGQRITLLSLDHGTAYYTGQPASKDVTVLVMPGAQMTILQGSRVRQTAQAGASLAAILEGQVRFTSPSAEMDLLEGNTAQVEPANPAKFAIEPGIVVQPLDKWSEDRDKAQARPASSAYVNAAYGLADLDSAGKWTQAGDLGMVWKPDEPEGWMPYQNGRWRYFEQLGYTWVSADPWGWMPYHNGRWTRAQKLGWVWQPAPSTVFHPAEVYWLRGANFVGWGPLAPGEEWVAPNPGTVTPQAYTSGSTTYAAFAPDLRTIDGSGFPVPPSEQLKTAFFVPAPPSPAFLVSRLDAMRPALQAGSTHVVPVVPGVGFGDVPQPPSDVMTTPPPDQGAQPPVSDAGAPPPPPDGVYPVPAVIVPVEVPVLYPDAADHPTYSPRRPGAGGPGGTQSQTGNPPTAMRPAASGTTAPSRPTSVTPVGGGSRQGPPPPPPNPGSHAAPPPVQSSPAPSTIQSHPAPPAIQSHPVAPPPSNPGSRPAPPAIQSHPSAPPAAAPKNDGSSKKAAANEQELYRMVLQDIDPKEANLSNALADLNVWSSRFPKSSYANQRSYFLIHVYSRLDRPVEVLDTAAPLVGEGVRKIYSDDEEVLQILVAASAGVSKLSAPTAQQLATGHRAARELAEFLPQYFAPGRRPAGVRPADWSAARNQLEGVARQAMEYRPAVRLAAAR